MRRTGLLAVSLAVVAAFGLGLALRPFRGHVVRATPAEEVRAELAAHYYRRLPRELLAQQSVGGLIAGLDDRYTRYLSPAAYRLARRAEIGGYSGIGVSLVPAPGGLLVTRTQVGPARLAGIRPGDSILAVDGEEVAQLSYGEALGRILGRSGSSVSLRVRRADRTIRFRLVRRSYRIPTVHARLLGSVGVVRLDRFTRGTAQGVETAVRRLGAAGARSLVLDLRGNPGGLLDQAVGVASLFLERGQSVVSLAGAHRPARMLFTRGAPATRLPLAVLVDRSSASASEVVAAALREHRRATIVGERTFGKSLVQEIEPLSSGAALKLTVARYLTPSGIDLSARGVRPDVRSGHALATALRILGP